MRLVKVNLSQKRTKILLSLINDIERLLINNSLVFSKSPRNQASFERIALQFTTELNNSQNQSISNETLLLLNKATRNLLRSTTLTDGLRTELQHLSDILQNTAVGEPLDSNVLSGQINQLSIRQSELNKLVKTSVERINNDTEKSISNISRFYDKKILQLQELEANISSSTSNDISKQLSSALRDIEKTSNNQINTIKLDIRTEATKAIDSAIENTISSLDKYRDETIDDVKSQVDSLSSNVSQQINEFVELNQALRKTLNYIATDALADTSIKQANSEKSTADLLRGVGILWLLSAIIYFITHFNYSDLVNQEGAPQYTLILLRTFIIVFCSAPGFYILRESARHRTDERRYRQKGIQLATIDGYFAEFEGQDKNEIKKDLSKHYFHGDDHFVDASSVDRVQSSYDKVFDSVLNKASRKNQKNGN